MKLKYQILRAILKGLNESLNYIEDIDDEDDFELSKKSISQAIKDSNDLKSYYSKKLQLMLPNPMDINDEFINQAIELHENCGATYNPHLDNPDDLIEFVINRSKILNTFIRKCIEIQGNNANLNWIDTSEVTNMYKMFVCTGFNGDISEWDVSHVRNMESMFQCSGFNSVISSWDVSNVTNMKEMFDASDFNKDISMWDVSHVTLIHAIFVNCPIKEAYKPKFNCYE